MSLERAIAGVGNAACFCLSFSLGANTVANALGTSVGAKVLSLKTALIIGTIFEALGVLTLGGFSAQDKDVDPIIVEYYSNDHSPLLLGLLCALIASAFWILVATLLSIPVATTHTVFTGIIAFSAVEKGFSSIQLDPVMKAIVGMIVSPIVGGLIAFCVFFIIHRTVFHTADPLRRGLVLLPYFTGLTWGILGLMVLRPNLQLFGVAIAWWGFLLITLLLYTLAALGVRFAQIPNIAASFQTYEVEEIEYESSSSEDTSSNSQDEESDSVHERFARSPSTVTEELFKGNIILTAVVMAFAQGTTSFATAIGLTSALWNFYTSKQLIVGKFPPFWILALATAGMVAGLWMYGRKVVVTIGEKITRLTYTRAYAAQLATALTLILGSVMGIPVDISETLVGALIGTALVPGTDIGVGMTASNIKTVIKIVVTWILTFVAIATITICLFLLLRNLNHPNLIRYLGVFSRPSEHFIVTEFIEFGSVKDLFEKEKKESFTMFMLTTSG